MEGISGGCWHQAGSGHTTGLGSCSQLSLLARHWGSAVPSHGALELGPPVGAHSWEGEAKPFWVQGAVGTCWGAPGRWAPLPSCLGLSRKPSRWCFRGVKKQHMSLDPWRVAAAAMPATPPMLRGGTEGPRGASDALQDQHRTGAACIPAPRGILHEPLGPS